ncbi:MAG: VCBS repeat-containing protein, partial [Acidobacteriota bacterium]
MIRLGQVVAPALVWALVRVVAWAPEAHAAGSATDPESEEPPPARFTDVTEAAGIDFVHDNGAAGEKLLPETMGGGVAFFDYDRDGDQDLLFVDSGGWAVHSKARHARKPAVVLYANDGSGHFRDVTESAGLGVDAQTGRPPFYGQGVVAGDYDGDGWIDLYLTAVGPNRLLRNREGVFED